MKIICSNGSIYTCDDIKAAALTKHHSSNNTNFISLVNPKEIVDHQILSDCTSIILNLNHIITIEE
jgi:hypothetical protein